MQWCLDSVSSYDTNVEEILRNFTVLYVEDDTNAQFHIKQLLEDEVKELYQAYDGEEGFKIAQDKKPDIIITDIRMPKVDGLEMAKKIKSIEKCKPILITTAFDDKETLLNALQLKIHYFIPKPIDIDALLNNLYEIALTLQNKIDAEKARRTEIENLYYKAHYDTLTNVPNRVLFQKKLDQAINRAQRTNSKVTLFFIDLDNFKQVNDTYGHMAGDRLLEQVVKNIQDNIRLEDTLSRISGDEFSLIIEDIEDTVHIERIASKVLEACTQPLNYEGSTIEVSCSIGIAQYPQDGTTKEELIRHADIAMYEAKKSGKGKYSFSS